MTADAVEAVVISGTVGVGKTSVVEALGTLLERHGSRCALMDLDWLGQAFPPPSDDHFNNRLIFENLVAVAPNYIRRGYRRFVLARVVEDPEDRFRYQSALGGAAVTICHLTASEAARERRLVAREQDAEWRQWFLRRTVALATSLEESRHYDFAVSNDGRSAADTAAEVAGRLGWVG